MCQLSADEAATFCAQQQGGSSARAAQDAALLASAPVVALELTAAGSIRKWHDMLGERVPHRCGAAKGARAHGLAAGRAAARMMHSLLTWPLTS